MTLMVWLTGSNSLVRSLDVQEFLQNPVQFTGDMLVSQKVCWYKNGLNEWMLVLFFKIDKLYFYFHFMFILSFYHNINFNYFYKEVRLLLLNHYCWKEKKIKKSAPAATKQTDNNIEIYLSTTATRERTQRSPPTPLATAASGAATAASFLTLWQSWRGRGASRAASRRSGESGRRPRTARRASSARIWARRNTSWSGGWRGCAPRCPGSRAANPWQGKAGSGGRSPCPRWSPTRPGQPSRCQTPCGSIFPLPPCRLPFVPWPRGCPSRGIS